MRSFNSAQNNRLKQQYGAKDDELLPFHIFRNSVNMFWGKVLEINPTSSFVCENCGPRPKALCFDGVCIGLLTEKLKKVESGEQFDIPIVSEEILEAPDFKFRMFIKNHKNRKFLRACMESDEFPNFSKVDMKTEPNMKLIKSVCDELKKLGCKKLPADAKGIFKDISTQSSTVSLFQVVDERLMNELIQDLKLPGKISFSTEFIQKYPNVYERLRDIQHVTKQRREIPLSIKILYQKLTEFCLDFYLNTEEREEEVYTERLDGEVAAEFFPQFPAVYERARYKADQRGSRQEKENHRNLCSKLFPEHQKLTPGLFIMTCCCPKKRIYGIKKMIEGESPKIIFDIVMTRFEPEYSPDLIYDASCKAKEVGLNREPRRFMELLITSDPLHIENHSTCSDSFQSTKYKHLKGLNKEACEQFNSILRRIQTSLTYMTYKNYLNALKVFVAFHNILE